METPFLPQKQKVQSKHLFSLVSKATDLSVKNHKYINCLDLKSGVQFENKKFRRLKVLRKVKLDNYYGSRYRLQKLFLHHYHKTLKHLADPKCLVSKKALTYPTMAKTYEMSVFSPLTRKGFLTKRDVQVLVINSKNDRDLKTKAKFAENNANAISRRIASLKNLKQIIVVVIDGRAGSPEFLSSIDFLVSRIRSDHPVSLSFDPQPNSRQFLENQALSNFTHIPRKINGISGSSDYLLPRFLNNQMLDCHHLQVLELKVFIEGQTNLEYMKLFSSLTKLSSLKIEAFFAENGFDENMVKFHDILRMPNNLLELHLSISAICADGYDFFHFRFPSNIGPSLRRFMANLASLTYLQDLKLVYFIQPQDPHTVLLYSLLASVIKDKLYLRKLNLAITDQDWVNIRSPWNFSELFAGLGASVQNLQELRLVVPSLLFQDFQMSLERKRKLAIKEVSLSTKVLYMKGFCRFIRTFQPVTFQDSSLKLDIHVDEDEFNDLLDILAMPLHFEKAYIRVRTNTPHSHSQPKQNKIFELLSKISGPKDLTLSFPEIIFRNSDHVAISKSLNSCERRIDSIVILFHQNRAEGPSRFCFKKYEQNYRLKEYYLARYSNSHYLSIPYGNLPPIC